MKKVKSAETHFGKEMDYSHCGGKGAVVAKKVREREEHTGEHTGEHFPIATGLGNKRG